MVNNGGKFAVKRMRNTLPARYEAEKERPKVVRENSVSRQFPDLLTAMA